MQIVAIQQGQQVPAVDSRALAEALGNEHRAIIQLIRKYEIDFQALGQLTFQMSVAQGGGGGMPLSFTTLNEPQCYFLLTLVRNTEQTVPLKRALIEKVMQAFNLIRAREQAANTRALESAGRRELAMDAKKAALEKMATQVITAAGVGQAYGGGKTKALAQLSIKGIQPVGYFTSMGKEVEVYPMLEVYQQFNAGMGPRDNRVLMAHEHDWTPYPPPKKFKLGSK